MYEWAFSIDESSIESSGCCQWYTASLRRGTNESRVAQLLVGYVWGAHPAGEICRRSTEPARLPKPRRSAMCSLRSSCHAQWPSFIRSPKDRTTGPSSSSTRPSPRLPDAFLEIYDASLRPDTRLSAASADAPSRCSVGWHQRPSSQCDEDHDDTVALKHWRHAVAVAAIQRALAFISLMVGNVGCEAAAGHSPAVSTVALAPCCSTIGETAEN